MAGGGAGATGLPAGMAPAVGANPTAAELSAAAKGAGVSPLSQFAHGLPQLMQSVQAAKGMQPQGHPAMAPSTMQHPMSGAPVQMQGLLGSPQISVPQMNQALARSNGLLG